MNTFELEKQEYPLLIEGTLRHQNNINIAKTKYGNTFHCKIIIQIILEIIQLFLQ